MVCLIYTVAYNGTSENGTDLANNKNFDVNIGEMNFVPDENQQEAVKNVLNKVIGTGEKRAEKLAAELAAKKATEELAAAAIAAEKAAEELAAELAAKKAVEELAAELAAKKAAEELAAELAAKKAAEELAAELAANNTRNTSADCDAVKNTEGRIEDSTNTMGKAVNETTNPINSQTGKVKDTVENELTAKNGDEQVNSVSSMISDTYQKLVEKAKEWTNFLVSNENMMHATPVLFLIAGQYLLQSPSLKKKKYYGDLKNAFYVFSSILLTPMLSNRIHATEFSKVHGSLTTRWLIDASLVAILSVILPKIHFPTIISALGNSLKLATNKFAAWVKKAVLVIKKWGQLAVLYLVDLIFNKGIVPILKFSYTNRASQKFIDITRRIFSSVMSRAIFKQKNQAKDSTKDLVNSIGKNTDTVVGAIKNGATQAKDKVVGKVQSIAGSGVEKSSGLLESLRDKVKNLKSKIKDPLRDQKSEIDSLEQQLKKLIEVTHNKISKAKKEEKKSIEKLMREAVKYMKGDADEAHRILRAINEQTYNTGTDIKKIYKNIAEEGKVLFNDLKDNVKQELSDNKIIEYGDESTMGSSSRRGSITSVESAKSYVEDLVIEVQKKIETNKISK